MSVTDRPAELAPDGEPATTHVDERQARQVAEAARETTWRKPSFGKELFLGRLRLDLIDPPPTPEPEVAARGAEFLSKLRAYAESDIDGAQIERDAFIPDEVLRGLAELGAFGMKIGQSYGGLGLSNLNRLLCASLSESEADQSGLSSPRAESVPARLACG